MTRTERRAVSGLCWEILVLSILAAVLAFGLVAWPPDPIEYTAGWTRK